MKKTILFLLLACTAVAQTAQNRAALYAQFDTLFADTGPTDIAPADVRTAFKDTVASAFNALNDGTAVVTSGSYSDPVWLTALNWSKITSKPTLGTAAALDVPASGNAASGEVVKGSDTRLTDARTPTTHTHTASQVSDSTAVGRDLMTAANAAAARTVIGAGTSSFSGAYGDLTGKPNLGTAAALDVPASGNAASGEVVKGNDTRLTDSRTPTTHTHTAAQISDSTTVGRDVLTAANAAAARTAIGAGTSSFSGAYADLSGKPTLGTAAALDVPASGNAASGEVVKGSDTRLSDARTPTTHTHAQSEVTNLTTDLAAKSPTLNNTGSGETLIANASTGQLKKLIAGSNITLTAGADGLTLASSGGGGGGWATGLLFTTSSSTTNISNSNAETSIFAGTVPGGTLGTQGAIRFVLTGQYTNNSGANQSVTLKVKYGATTLYAATSGAVSASATPRTWRLDFILFADGATGAQRLEGIGLPIGPAGTATSGYGALSGTDASVSKPIGGTASEDSTADKTLDVTITLSTSTATCTWVTHKAAAWKL